MTQILKKTEIESGKGASSTMAFQLWRSPKDEQATDLDLFKPPFAYELAGLSFSVLYDDGRNSDALALAPYPSKSATLNGEPGEIYVAKVAEFIYYIAYSGAAAQSVSFVIDTETESAVRCGFSPGEGLRCGSLAGGVSFCGATNELDGNQVELVMGHEKYSVVRMHFDAGAYGISQPKINPQFVISANYSYCVKVRAGVYLTLSRCILNGVPQWSLVCVDYATLRGCGSIFYPNQTLHFGAFCRVVG
ncbi:MAG: hypothetical protein LBS90_00510 [Oscillospiraceae bacterium]|jgi:hypothetical protein|nr:hypothetical protein [Oscillospiraceae bacterium]